MPDHPVYRTWRGTLDEYQQLIAGCGIVYGTSTSSHVLGQLIGKPVVALYASPRKIYATIGAEDGRLFPHQRLDEQTVQKIVAKAEAHR